MTKQDSAVDARDEYAERQQRDFFTVIGQVAVALGADRQYAGLPISELTKLVAEPLVRGQVLIASLPATEQHLRLAGGLSGIVFSASVSSQVDGKIRAQIERKEFPIVLDGPDLNSGDNRWILDVIAADINVAMALTDQYMRSANSKTVNLHPQVAAKLGAEALSKLGLGQTSQKTVR